MCVNGLHMGGRGAAQSLLASTEYRVGGRRTDGEVKMQRSHSMLTTLQGLSFVQRPTHQGLYHRTRPPTEHHHDISCVVPPNGPVPTRERERDGGTVWMWHTTTTPLAGTSCMGQTRCRLRQQQQQRVPCCAFLLFLVRRISLIRLQIGCPPRRATFFP